MIRLTGEMDRRDLDRLTMLAVAGIIGACAYLGVMLAMAFLGHFRPAGTLALAPMLLTAAVVLANELRAVLGRLPSRDLKSGDRGEPGLPGHVMPAELSGQSPLSVGQLSGQVTAVSGQVSSGQVSGQVVS